MLTKSSLGGDLDRFEEINAADWDAVSESQSSAGQQEVTPARGLEFSKIEKRVRLSSFHPQDWIHSKSNRVVLQLLQLFTRSQPILMPKQKHPEAILKAHLTWRV
jgi:hypothetical protein